MPMLSAGQFARQAASSEVCGPYRYARRAAEPWSFVPPAAQPCSHLALGQARGPRLAKHATLRWL